MARIVSSRMDPAKEAAPRALPLWRLLGVCAVALTTANCANNPQKFAGASGGNGIDPKYGVRASKRLYNEGEVIPKGGGRRFSGKPYVVAGRTYVPRENASGYVREGLASWYGSAFHGRVTANGEVFDRHSIAAAHPTLPLPSYARVTNLSNGNSMVVRVNDRGPYHANRVMDVSEEVARALEFHNKGTAHVRVEYVGKASVAGSDDRKLMATLRTDGRLAPTGPNSPVMVADLGPDVPSPSPERFARAAGPALAFKPAEESESASEGASEASARRRPAPVLVASAASVAVPAALQPTALRSVPFRPAPVATASFKPAPASAGPAAIRTAAVIPARGVPLSLAPPPLRLAGAAPERAPIAASREGLPRGDRSVLVSAGFSRPALAAPMSATRAAAIPAPVAIPNSAKLAMAKLVAASAAPALAKGKANAMPDTKLVAPRRRVAEVY